MIKIVLVFFIIASTFIYCDARYDCYEHSSGLNVASGVCELFTTLNYNDSLRNGGQVPQPDLNNTIILCLRQQQIRKTCDSKSQYWPLPKNFNQGKNRGL